MEHGNENIYIENGFTKSNTGQFAIVNNNTIHHSTKIVEPSTKLVEPSTKLVLRPYQQNIIKECRNAFIEGFKKILIVMPCGAGKTVCFADMAIKHCEKYKNNTPYVWFLVHRKELVDQTKATFDKFNIDTKNVYIGMVSQAKKIQQKPTLIIIDEAHHATAKTWTKAIDLYPNTPIIGLTATPARYDGTGLGIIFDKIVEGINSQDLIEQKYLSEYDYYAPAVSPLPKMRGKDFDVSQIQYQPKIYGDVMKYIDSDKKTIIYCPNIKFSKQLEEELINSGINAKHFDGKTPKAERTEIIKQFRAGTIRALLNVDLIGEGFDVPDCNCCMLLRPTMSTALYIQQSMRCLRPKEGKRATIYDFVGNVFRHGLPTDIRQWSLSGKVKTKNPTGLPEIVTRTCGNCFRIYSGQSPICPYCGHDNGISKHQIEQDKKAQLQKIKEIKINRRKREIDKLKTFNDLVVYAEKRCNPYPYKWARITLKKRKLESK